MDKNLYCIKCGAIIKYENGERLHASSPVAQEEYDKYCKPAAKL